MGRFRRPVGAALVAACVLAVPCRAQRAGAVSSRSYRGHESEADIANFVRAYPAAAGTRLDDCQTCHRGGSFTVAARGRTVQKNPCDYCHLVRHPADGYVEPLPKDFRATLNGYGLAYLEAGRSVGALRAIGRRDSDRDGSSNRAEIAAGRYPGDPASRPGQPSAPTRVFSAAELRALPAHGDFLLVNASRQADDYYAGYTGVRVRDLLVAAGVDPDAAGFTGVTVFAPDGFARDLGAREVNTAYPTAAFFGGLDAAHLGPECGFVRYPDPLPAGVRDGAPIPGEQWLLLAWARDGRPMDPASLDPATGRIRGEGPLRLVVPQSRPGAPDRGSASQPEDCGGRYPYDERADHNADPMVRGVIAIRVNPLPAGVEDFDIRNGGWAYVTDGRVAVYGTGVKPR